MPTRSYGQYCALAKALDVVGERWTLLIVRELFAGPQRFSDLLHALPGIGTGMLAARLREMRAANIIELAELPPPAASHVYRLTPRGRQLDAALSALGRWGGDLLGPAGSAAHANPLWLLQSFAARTATNDASVSSASVVLAAGDVEKPHAASLPAQFDVNIQLDSQWHHLRVRGSRVIARRGARSPASASVSTDSETLLEVCQNHDTLTAALNKGRLAISGDRDAALAVLDLLAVRPAPGADGFEEM